MHRKLAWLWVLSAKDLSWFPPEGDKPQWGLVFTRAVQDKYSAAFAAFPNLQSFVTGLGPPQDGLFTETAAEYAVVPLADRSQGYGATRVRGGHGIWRLEGL
jgi:hypothetical protein